MNKSFCIDILNVNFYKIKLLIEVNIDQTSIFRIGELKIYDGSFGKYGSINKKFKININKFFISSVSNLPKNIKMQLYSLNSNDEIKRIFSEFLLTYNNLHYYFPIKIKTSEIEYPQTHDLYFDITDINDNDIKLNQGDFIELELTVENSQ